MRQQQYSKNEWTSCSHHAEYYYEDYNWRDNNINFLATTN